MFRKYRSAADYARTPPAELERDIQSTGFFRNKAKSIQNCCRILLEHCDGEVPKDMEKLVELPGIGRKTANVVLGTAYRIPACVVVDTHVFRIARRLKLSQQNTPEKVEQDLMKLVPQDRWIAFGHQMIWFGRKICAARKPLCANCPLESVCDSPDKTV